MGEHFKTHCEYIFVAPIFIPPLSATLHQRMAVWPAETIKLQSPNFSGDKVPPNNILHRSNKPNIIELYIVWFQRWYNFGIFWNKIVKRPWDSLLNNEGYQQQMFDSRIGFNSAEPLQSQPHVAYCWPHARTHRGGFIARWTLEWAMEKGAPYHTKMIKGTFGVV